MRAGEVGVVTTAHPVQNCTDQGKVREEEVINEQPSESWVGELWETLVLTDCALPKTLILLHTLTHAHTPVSRASTMLPAFNSGYKIRDTHGWSSCFH